MAHLIQQMNSIIQSFFAKLDQFSRNCIIVLLCKFLFLIYNNKQYRLSACVKHCYAFCTGETKRIGETMIFLLSIFFRNIAVIASAIRESFIALLIHTFNTLTCYKYFISHNFTTFIDHLYRKFIRR